MWEIIIFLWECFNSDESGCPFWIQCQSWQKWVCEPYNGIMEGPKEEGGLVWCITFSSTSCDKGCWCIAYMGNIWHLDACWKEGKLGETVGCFGPCSVARQWGVFLKRAPYHSTVATAFQRNLVPDVCGLFQQGTVSSHKAKNGLLCARYHSSQCQCQAESKPTQY